MAPDSRIWVYQANKELDPSSIAQINILATAFIDDWSSHGFKMRATAEVLYNRFVIIAVDEAAASASGCGIDKSFRFIQTLENELGITLLDRTVVAWEEEGILKSASLSAFEKHLKEGKVSKETIVFNNLVNTKADLEQSWRVPLSQSWHARLLKA